VPIRTVRLVEIADILGVTHQRAGKIVAMRLPKAGRTAGASRRA